MMINDEILHIRDRIISAVPTQKLILFGSFANGTAGEDSDYDFYIVVPDGGIRPVDAIGDAYLSMRGMKRRPVDILAGTETGFTRRCEHMTLERKISREGIVLYERGK